MFNVRPWPPQFRMPSLDQAGLQPRASTPARQTVFTTLGWINGLVPPRQQAPERARPEGLWIAQAVRPADQGKRSRNASQHTESWRESRGGPVASPVRGSAPVQVNVRPFRPL